MNQIFEKSFTVRYHELDYNGNFKPLALLHCLQDVAGLHAARLGVSVKDLHEQGLTWVMSRMHLKAESYQRADESILIRTWPSTRQGMFTCREFEAVNTSGAITAKATTSWAAVKLATKRPVKLDQYLPLYPMLPTRAIETDFERLPDFPQKTADSEILFRVLRTDLDINQHVNNVIYMSWALETVPDSVAAGTLIELEASFRAEALYGESVLSRCSVIESGDIICCMHQICSKSDGKELVRLRTHWRKQPYNRGLF